MAEIFYKEVDDFLRKEDRYKILDSSNNVYYTEWEKIEPDSKNTWLQQGLMDEFDNFIPIGTKEAKSRNGNAVFNNYSLGINTNRDAWCYNFNSKKLANNINSTIVFFNEQIYKYSKINPKPNIDNFVDYDENKISWSSTLKEYLKQCKELKLNENKIRKSFYRPFVIIFLYFDNFLIDRQGQFPKILPSSESENENKIICLNGLGMDKPFHSLIVNFIPNLQFTPNGQCFPFYTYDEDGANRRENITDWGLKEFQKTYEDDSITKWDIFYYIYGVLHHPNYRQRYQANLRRELPRIPYLKNFWAFAEAGRALADLHINYETQPEYYLERIENPNKQFTWRVEKMYLYKDKDLIKYNDFLTLTGIPAEVYEYKLGNRSALEWIIDQYQVKTDKRSGITNDPNRDDEPEYIFHLLGKIITVSLETVKIVKALPEFRILELEASS